MSKEDILKQKIKSSFDCKNCKYECHCRFGAGYDLSEDCDCDADAYAEGFESGWDDALKSQWINVEERMPKVEEYVLVMIEYEENIQIHSLMYRGETIWKFAGLKIIAWMPIPPLEKILEANKDVLQRLKDK